MEQLIVNLSVTVGLTKEQVIALNEGKMQLKVVRGDLSLFDTFDAIQDFITPSLLEGGDYKDYYREEAYNHHRVISSLVGAEVVEFNDGPRYWFIKFTIDGRYFEFGPGVE